MDILYSYVSVDMYVEVFRSLELELEKPKKKRKLIFSLLLQMPYEHHFE